MSSENMAPRRRAWAAALATALLLSACGGGGGDDGGGSGGTTGGTGGGGTTPPPVTKTGHLIDGKVGGVYFVTVPDGKNGTTDADGTFTYPEGGSVTFSVGGVTLGSVPGQDTVTPQVLANATATLPSGVASSDVAQNIAVFLQTFDSDGNPDNGITISAEVANAAASVTLNFGQKSGDFGKDPSLTKLASDTGSTVVTPDAAAAHQTRVLADELAGSWTITDKNGSVDVVTFFTDGTYVLGEMAKDPDCQSGVEWGRYIIDPNAGTLTTGVSYVDTNSDCGLHVPGNTQPSSTFTLDGDTLTLKNTDSTFALTRVPAGTALAGSWLLNQPVADGAPIYGPAVLTLFGDGHYLIADDRLAQGDSTDGDDAKLGMEYGSWSVASDGTLTSHADVDTNGSDTGLSSNLTPGTKLSIDNSGVLVLAEPGFDPVKFTRLPLKKTIDVSDLSGSWYAVDDDGAISAATFFNDGSYVFGSQGSDPDCDRDYGNANPAPGGTLDPDGMGSEFGQWYLETGLGRVYTANLSVDSDGSCGFHNKNNPADPSHEAGIFFKKIDADTLQLTGYEHQDGGTNETTDDTYEPSTHQIKRVPSQANSLIGSWKLFTADGTFDEVVYFFADGTLFESNIAENGGVGRKKWTKNTDGTVTIGPDKQDPLCVDTIYADSECTSDGAPPAQMTVTFSSNGKQATLVNKNDPSESFKLEKI